MRYAAFRYKQTEGTQMILCRNKTKKVNKYIGKLCYPIVQ